METVLSIDDVVVKFDGVVAVAGVGFAVGRGELVGLIGPNGAGKSTLLHCVIGTLRPNAGRIVLEGREITKLNPDRRARRGLALTHQIVKPFRSMSVLDNVTLAAGYAKTASVLRAIQLVSRAAERRRAVELLELVDIADYAEAWPSTLPLGALKRLEVARALAIRPKVLLLDEPLAGLNNVEASRLANTLRDLNANGTTMILIEHNLGKVAEICERVVVLDNGQKIAEGPTRETLADPAVVAAYIGREAVAKEAAGA